MYLSIAGDWSVATAVCYSSAIALIMEDTSSLLDSGLGELCHRLSSSAFIDLLLEKDSLSSRLAEYIYDVYEVTDLVLGADGEDGEDGEDDTHGPAGGMGSAGDNDIGGQDDESSEEEPPPKRVKPNQARVSSKA